MPDDLIERFLMKRVDVHLERWAIGVAVCVFALGVVLFGAAVELAATEPHRSNFIADAALGVARIPVTAKQVFKKLGKTDLEAFDQRFNGLSGFVRNGESTIDADSAVLLARYDHDKRRSVVEVLRLSDGAVVHEYAPAIAKINERSKLPPDQVDYDKDKSPARYMMSHPIIEADGSLIFHGMYTPLVKIDRCSNIIWTIDRIFHHSIERDVDGNYWTVRQRVPPEIKLVRNDFFDDMITKFSSDGKILYERSVAQLFIDNGMRHYVYGQGVYQSDPFHLNDIQPARADGKYWKKGDLFLSLRNRSMIAIFRPSTDQIVWYKEGPWLMQHDVNILDNNRISVFSNNAAATFFGERVLGDNETIVFDFSTGATTSPYREAFAKYDVRTVTEGRSRIMPDGGLFVEEQNFGRLIKFNKNGGVDWQYVNRKEGGRVYLLRWSRFIDAALTRQILPTLTSAECSVKAPR